MYSISVNVLATLDRRIQERHLLTHPFYQAWSAGTLSLRALQEYSKQYYRHVEAFPTYVSAVHANCPLLPIRQHLLENLIEEERGADNHPDQRVLHARPCSQYMRLRSLAAGTVECH